MAKNLAHLQLANAGEVSNFLAFVTAEAPASAWIALVGIKRKKLRSESERELVFRHFKVTSMDSAVQYVQQLVADKRDAYVQVSTLHRLPVNGRGSKDDVAGSSLLWLDYDSYKAGETKEQTTARLSGLEDPPTLMVDSGGGIHAYWRLSAFHQGEALEGRNLALALKLQQDHCHSAEHLLRIPGTWNFKEEQPRRVSVIKQTDTVYDIEQFDVADTSAATNDLEIIEEEDVSPAEMAGFSPELRTRITVGHTSDDRSENDWFVACALAERGFTKGQILSVFMNSDNYAGQKARSPNGYRYALRTINKAVAVSAKKFKVRPQKAVLHEVLDPLIVIENGKQRIDIPVYTMPLIEATMKVLVKHGYRFVYDSQDSMPYILSPEGEMIAAREHNTAYQAWISHITLFTAEARAYKMFLSGIAAWVADKGERAMVRPWSWVDTTTGTLWVLGDHDQFRSIYCVKGGSQDVRKVPNGTDNNLFFPSDNTIGNSLDIPDTLADIPIRDIGKLLDLTWNYFAVPDEIKTFLLAYMLAAPVAHCYVRHGMLPMLHLTGKAGQGKTDILKTFCAFLTGEAEPESGTTIASARSIANRDVILPFDDYENLSKEMKEFVLTSATGSKRHKMAQDKTKVTTQRSHILVAISSIADLPTDTLRRRAFRVEVSSARYPTKGYNTLFRDKLLRSRSQFWAVYMKWLAKDILPVLTRDEFYTRVDSISSKITVQEFKPMAEFLALSMLLIEKLGAIDGRVGRPAEEYLDSWIEYFRFNDSATLEAYDEFPLLLSSLGDRVIADIRSGSLPVAKAKGMSVGGGEMRMSPGWLQSISLEHPNLDLLQRQGPLPFEPTKSLVLVGKLSSWTSMLQNNGGRNAMLDWSNPIKQLENKLRNLIGVNGSVIDTLVSDFGEYGWHSKVYKIGAFNLWVQFLAPQNTEISTEVFVRLWIPMEAYTWKQVLRRPGLSEEAKTLLKSKLESGQITKEEAATFLAAIKGTL